MSKNFNSSDYSIKLDGEVTASLSDAEAIAEQFKQLLDLAEAALNQEIERTDGNLAIARRDA